MSRWGIMDLFLSGLKLDSMFSRGKMVYEEGSYRSLRIIIRQKKEAVGVFLTASATHRAIVTVSQP